ncbi:uncharacterized protein B0T23DRAFT_394548 [Neurospora hispaniola]|uniref:Uncharacterized protein n=1 Tax=Neurospora hispaniola TaxID=588809 RepID=A0AAJ0I9K6_9PEZI|nr:hypothetical protein B0T23DRAFT_394548 [Neurospora hispaniola]
MDVHYYMPVKHEAERFQAAASSPRYLLEYGSQASKHVVLQSVVWHGKLNALFFALLCFALLAADTQARVAEFKAKPVNVKKSSVGPAVRDSKQMEVTDDDNGKESWRSLDYRYLIIWGRVWWKCVVYAVIEDKLNFRGRYTYVRYFPFLRFFIEKTEGLVGWVGSDRIGDGRPGC